MSNFTTVNNTFIHIDFIKFIGEINEPMFDPSNENISAPERFKQHSFIVKMYEFEDKTIFGEKGWLIVERFKLIRKFNYNKSDQS